MKSEQVVSSRECSAVTVFERMPAYPPGPALLRTLTWLRLLSPVRAVLLCALLIQACAAAGSQSGGAHDEAGLAKAVQNDAGQDASYVGEYFATDGGDNQGIARFDQGGRFEMKQEGRVVFLGQWRVKNEDGDDTVIVIGRTVEGDRPRELYFDAESGTLRLKRAVLDGRERIASASNQMTMYKKEDRPNIKCAGHPPDDGSTALHRAAECGTLAEVERQIALGADVNARLGEGGNVWYSTSFKDGSTKTKTQAGATPLHLAAANGRLDVVRRLVAAGADPNAEDAFEDRPSEDALLHRNLATYEFLLKLETPR